MSTSLCGRPKPNFFRPPAQSWNTCSNFPFTKDSAHNAFSPQESDSCRSVSVCARCTSGCGSKFSNVTFSSATIPDCVEVSPHAASRTCPPLVLIRSRITTALGTFRFWSAARYEMMVSRAWLSFLAPRHHKACEHQTKVGPRLRRWKYCAVTIARMH